VEGAALIAECYKTGAVNRMKQVLVVEADEVLTEMMIELLSRDGCAVIAVRTIGEAISCLAGRDADVDMVMVDADTVPVGNFTSDGLIQWQTWFDECPRPPACVVASVQADSARVLHALLGVPQHGKRGGSPIWLRKPFRNDDLLSAVRQTAEERQAGSDA